MIAVVPSPGYAAAVWCQREAELARHLEARCDFLPARWIAEIELDQLPVLDRAHVAWRQRVDQWDAHFSMAGGFPPWSIVPTATVMNEPDLRLLRAAGALRVLHAYVDGAELAEVVRRALVATDAGIPAPPPTNGPGGWDAYRRVLREAVAETAEGDLGALALRPDRAVIDPLRRARLQDCIPDLSSGAPSLDDVLVAIEWQWGVLPMLRGGDFTNAILVDLRGLTRDEWQTSPRASALRGLAALRTAEQPIWLIQRPDQHVDTWGIAGDRPIFTEYDARQFGWLSEATLGEGWQEAYLRDGDFAWVVVARHDSS